MTQGKNAHACDSASSSTDPITVEECRELLDFLLSKLVLTRRDLARLQLASLVRAGHKNKTKLSQRLKVSLRTIRRELHCAEKNVPETDA